MLGQRTPSNRYYPIADSLGSIVAVTDKDGNLVGRHDYEPFGAEQGSPAFNSPFRFAGELYHPNHKLYKIGARWYDPKLGRWTQPDLIEQPKDPVQANRYQYAGQNPVNYLDPTGLAFDPVNSAEIEGGGGPVSCGYGENDDGTAFSGCNPSLQVWEWRRFKIGGGVHGVASTGEHDGGGLGVTGCVLACVGVSSDTGISFGGGLDVSLSLDFDVF